ncbi:MAG: permease [Chloroflexi bacterium]|nr:permease [Chloroflexota bacterium]
MDTATWIMAVIALLLLLFAFLRGGNVHVAGVRAGAKMLWGVLPLLLLSFLVAGLLQVLIPKEQIRRWLGTESGLRGIILGCIAGGLVPGPPYAVFPVVASLYQAGAGIGAVVGFVTAWSLWSASRFPTELAILGPRPALIRFLSTLVFPPLAGLFAQHVLSRLA